MKKKKKKRKEWVQKNAGEYVTKQGNHFNTPYLTKCQTPEGQCIKYAEV